MSDRKLGYAIISLFLLIILVIAFYGLRPLISPGETRVVAFTTIGNLRQEDPIRVRGVLYGTCRNISWKNDAAGKRQRVYVTIKTTKPIPIHRGYLVVNMDEGVMGDRMIMVDCGDSAAPLVPAKDTLVGTFYPGVSEAIDYAWRLRGAMDTFLTMSEVLLHGAGPHTSLVAQVNGVLLSADSISQTVLSMTRKASYSVGTQVRSLNSLVDSATTITRTFAAAAPEFVENSGTRLREIRALAIRLGRTADTLEALSKSLRSPTNILWKSDVEDIRKHLVELQTTIDAVEQRLLQFKIYLKL
jgi:ABC-type transporter Mla subunit MlaD